MSFTIEGGQLYPSFLFMRAPRMRCSIEGGQLYRAFPFSKASLDKLFLWTRLTVSSLHLYEDSLNELFQWRRYQASPFGKGPLDKLFHWRRSTVLSLHLQKGFPKGVVPLKEVNCTEPSPSERVPWRSCSIEGGPLNWAFTFMRVAMMSYSIEGG